MPTKNFLPFIRLNGRFVLLAGLVLALIIIANAAVSIYVLRQNTIQDRAEQLETLTLMMAEHTAQTLFSANTVLDSIMDVVELAKPETEAEYREFAAKNDQFLLLVDKTKSNPIIDVSTFVSDKGKVINFSRSFPPPQIDLSDRDYFIWLRDHNTDETFYSVPVQNKGNGKWVFYLARRVNNSKSEFLGVILVGVSAEVFSTLYERIGSSLGTGSSLALYRQDQTLQTRWPFVDSLIGTINKNGLIERSVFHPKKNGAAIFATGPRFTANEANVDRMLSFRKLDSYPFISGATITKDLYLANWLKDSKGIIYSTLFSLLILGLSVAMLIRAYNHNARIQFLAQHDPLTGLPNRTLLADRTERELATARRNKTNLALIYIDLDNFKKVNDALGHAAGDEVLQMAAEKLTRSVRDTDTVSRIGGDEFIVLLAGVEGRENVLLLAEKIRLSLTRTIISENKTFTISASMGIALYPDHGANQQELQSNADSALYQSKNDGRNNVRIFNPDA